MNTVQNVLENEAVVFILYGAAVALLALYFGYLLRRWSWVPRKQQRQRFGERW